MKTKLIIAAGLLTNMLLAQSVQKRMLPDFTQLNANVSTTVYLQKADAPYILISQDDSTKSADIKAEVSNGTLMIRSSKNGEMPAKITVGYLTLNGIEGNGAVNIKTMEVLSTDRLELDLNGAAKCKMDLSVNIVSANASGAATINVSGNCNKMEAIISGAASLKAEGLVTQDANINTSGASTAKVNVTNKLEGNASGASSLKFTGEPKETQINQSGASSIKRMDSKGNSEAVASASTGDSTKHYTINGRYEIIVHDKKGEDTTTMQYKKRKKYGVRKQNWAGVELFENGYLTRDNDVSLPAAYDYMSPDYGIKNLGCNLNLFEKDFRFAGGKLQVVTGLGFSWNAYALKNKTILNPDSAYTGYSYNTSASFSKNKLKESFVTVPLLFELNTSRRDSRNFHIAAGVIGGVKLGSTTKQYYSMGGHDFRDFKHDDYNLFPFKLDATVRVGYGDFTMFATYSLTPLFEYNKGPELYPFTVGVRIIPF